MTYGLTSTGFAAKTVEEILADIETAEQATIDPTLDVTPTEPLGQINGIFSKAIAEVWELLATAYGANDPLQAEGFLADNIAAITGTTRDPATLSTVTCNLVLNAGFAGASAGGMHANVAGHPETEFVNRDAVAATGVTVTVPAVFVATTTGPIAAYAGTLTVIKQALSNWTSITNPLDAVLGSLAETDAQLEARRETELSAEGGCTVDSLRAKILPDGSGAGVAGVLQCLVFENQTLFTDGTGLPGKAIEVVIYDGPVPAAADQDVVNAIWPNKPTGAQTYGGSSHSIVDTQGETRTVYFSRASVLPVYFEWDVTTDPAKFPADGVQQIKDLAASYAAAHQTINVPVVALAYRAQALAIPGVTDCTALRLGFAASPIGTTNLPITGRQVAAVDTSRMLVNVS